jgi:membrane-associated protease RseP (regulator of RpoE activity)
MSPEEPTEGPTLADVTRFEQLKGIVESEFTIEESFLQRGIPTFHVKLEQNSKEAFLRLFKRLDVLNHVPVLRRKENNFVLQIITKPAVKPDSYITNVGLFIATVITTFVTGYMLSIGWVERNFMSNPWFGALSFTVAIMAILGSHEMAHKFAAKKHDVEASYPYFIPGPPLPLGIGTFGAVIRQKSLAPNKDALFDLGISGPIVGFLMTIIVTIVGVQFSHLIPEAPPGAQLLPIPMLFVFIVNIFPPTGTGNIVWLHPVAFAGWVGMLVTMLNLIPAGMLDGGHAARGLMGRTARTVLSFMAILLLLFLEHYLFAFIAFFFSLQEHPGPLDDVSKLSTSRKLTSIALIAIFILTVVSF